MFFINLSAQTVKHPIGITLNPLTESVSQGQNSALILELAVPEGVWLGATKSANRNPPATKIKIEEIDGFTFGEPIVPDPYTVDVPVRVGKTNVYKGIVKIIIPFDVDENVSNGDYELSVVLTYTPALNAGKLSSHVREKYSTSLRITDNQNATVEIPQPSVNPPNTKLKVETYESKVSPFFRPLFFSLMKEDTGAGIFHTIWRDPADHDKRIQALPIPFFNVRRGRGTSRGLGLSLLNSTPQGALTGILSLNVFKNDFVGWSARLNAASCIAAYHNYQFFTQYSKDGAKHAHLRVENLTLGAYDNFGYQFQGDAFSESRFRYFGFGPESVPMNASNYTHEEYGAVLDLFYLPINHLRLGVGGKVKNVDIKEGNEIIGTMIPFLVNDDRYTNTPGINGATITAARASIIFDQRNQEFTPTSGFFGRITAEYDWVSDSQDDITAENYTKLFIELKQYLSTINQKWSLLLRNDWEFTSDPNAPFFELASLGGLNSLRAFEPGRYRGQNSVFVSAELRYKLFKFQSLGIPFAFELGVFVDGGQVFDDDGFDGDFIAHPGLSFRLLNPPNIGFVINAANGPDDIVYTGGVVLPF